MFWLYSLDNKNVYLGPRKDTETRPPKKDSYRCHLDQVGERTGADLKDLYSGKETGKIVLML